MAIRPVPPAGGVSIHFKSLLSPPATRRDQVVPAFVLEFGNIVADDGNEGVMGTENLGTAY